MDENVEFGLFTLMELKVRVSAFTVNFVEVCE